MKHTKLGNWTVQPKADKDAPDLVRVVAGAEGICLTSEANAHLIAAAPEMLEALEATHTQLVGGLDVYLRYEASHPLVGLALQIEELLRKAKGGA